MNFYNIHTVPQDHHAVVFKYSLWTHICWATLFMFSSVLFLSIGMAGGIRNETINLPSWLGYWIGAVCSFLFLYALTLMPARFKATNWIMKVGQERVLIKFRSYLNAHFDSKDVHIFEFPLRDVEWVRTDSVNIDLPNEFSSESSNTNIHNEYLELKLKDTDTSQLATYLKEERLKKGPKHGCSQGWANHYPVHVISEGVIRVECKEITPGIKTALKLLGGRLPIQTNQSTTVDLNSYKEKSDQEKNAKVLQLAQMGSTIQAIGLAKVFFNLNTTQAKAHVEALLKN